jgi:ABC transporter DrrB family efflux protein
MDRNPILQLSLARLRELLRQPEAIFWVFMFPIILALALGIAFRERGTETLTVGVQQGPRAEQLRTVIDADEGLRARVVDEDAARAQLRSGKLALVVVPGDPVTYWFDPVRPDGRLARGRVDDVLQVDAGREDPLAVSEREMTEKGSRYIDFLVPGLLGMNLMGTGLWGVGFAIVMARSRNLLKRMVASPMRRHHYLLGQMLGRVIFLFLEVGALLLFARLAFGVPVRGSIPSLLLVAFLGAMTFAGIGLLVASRVRTIEAVSGLMNLVMLPMWILSGIFFSTARFPEAMQPVVQALPLTAVNDALRAVMIDGESLAAVAGELLIAAAWGTAAFLAALGIFRWS